MRFSEQVDVIVIGGGHAGTEAALAAGEQGKFWQMHDLLFANQTALKLENLRARIVKVLAKHGVVVLDQGILDLPAGNLKSDSEVFLEGKKLTVGDAFFFRGI